jgi:hypothetical protein
MTNTLTATITGTEDSTGNVPINRGLGNLSFDSNFSDFVTYQSLSAGNNPITLPATKVYQIYVKNNDPAQNIGVTYTPTGLAAQVSPTLGPGEVFIIWQKNTNVGANAGITALTLTATAAALVEYFIGG